MIEETVGGRIKRLRLARGLTLEELAERIGISVNGLSAMESDAIRIFGPYLQPLSKALAVSTDYLQSGHDGTKDEIAEFAAANLGDPDQRKRFQEFVRETSFRTRNLNQQELHFLLEQFWTSPR